MKRLISLPFFVIIINIFTAYHIGAQTKLSIKTVSDLDELIKKMTIVEKIGQMTQINISKINTSGAQKDVVLDEKKYREVLQKYKIGSFLNGEAVSPEVWESYLDKVTRIGLEESRLGIPIIYGIDHIHGASYVANSTLFPHNISLASSFNTQLAFETGLVTAIESADLGHHWIFAPVLDVARTPLWARFYETYGEDPYTVSMMGEAFVKGIQENSETSPYKQAATAKHFLGYSDPKSGWDRTPVDLSMQSIHEIYRPSFQKAIDAGIKSIMVNSGEINGIPVHASKEILTDLLRNQMGFEGVILTDWGDLDKLVDYHKVAENFKEAVFLSIEAGIDMSMTPTHFRSNDALLELVNEGRISEARLDESVRRILKLKLDLGLFENPYPRKDRLNKIGSEKHNKMALNAARESIVLLKNDEMLPLKSSGKLVLVGKSVRDKKNWQGGWTYTWQGAKNEHLAHLSSFDAEMKKAFPSTEIIIYDEITSKNITKFEKDAKSADAIIVVAGEEPYTEFVGNINDLNLDEKQKFWIKSAIETGKPVSLILVEGRPRLFTEFNNKLKSVIYAGLPGSMGPQACAEILAGTVNPSAKLSFTYPAYPNHYIPYNHKSGAVYFFDLNQANFIQQKVKSTNLYSFGHGLSYSKFTYSKLTISNLDNSLEADITVNVSVKNTGNRSGKEAVLFFISDEVGSITRPVKELKHFEKIELEAGESKDLSFVIKPKLHLAFPNANGEYFLEKGKFTVLVDTLKKRFTLK